MLRCEGVFPTEEDLDWLMSAVQRHTGGMKGWWADNKDKLGPRDLADIFISVWEAGRMVAAQRQEADQLRGLTPWAWKRP